MSELTVGTRVRIRPGAPFFERTADAIGEVSAVITDHDSGERPRGEIVYHVRFPFPVLCGDHESISYANELEVVQP